MFAVIEKTTGKHFNVYGMEKGQFLIGTAKGFTFRDVSEFKPIEYKTTVSDKEPPSERKVYKAPTEKDLESLIGSVRTSKIKLNMGDIITIRLLNGEEVDLVEVEEFGSTIRFESRDCIGLMTSAVSLPAFLNKIYAQLPDSLARHIGTTLRLSLDETGCFRVRPSKLFVPAISEIVPPTDCLGNNITYKQLEWYKDRTNRIRSAQKGGEKCWYFTETTFVDYTAARLQCSVKRDGSSGLTHVDDLRYAPIAFHLIKV